MRLEARVGFFMRPVLESPAGLVSRRHAVLVVEDGKLYVHDLGSTNGTFVTGGRSTAGKS